MKLCHSHSQKTNQSGFRAVQAVQEGWAGGLVVVMVIWGWLCLGALQEPVLAELSAKPASVSQAKKAAQKKDAKSRPVEVAMLSYDRGKTASCFATRFLDLAARRGKLKVRRSLTTVSLAGGGLKDYPLAVFSGTQRFRLSGKEQKILKKYLETGGFVIASPGCANEVWNASFKKAMRRMMPHAKLAALPVSHPVFHTIYDLKTLHSSMGKAKPVLYGLKIKGRLVMVYASVGMNDTAHAGGDCCCCGGDEIRESDQLNANILAYVLTH